MYLKIIMIKSNEFINDIDNKYELTNGNIVNNIYVDGYINWENFNRKIVDNKQSGVMIICDGFPLDKMNFTPDIHIHISITKEKLKDYYYSNYNNNELEKKLLMINSLIYPYYIDVCNRSAFSVVYYNDGNLYDSIKKYIKKFIFMRLPIKNINNNFYTFITTPVNNKIYLEDDNIIIDD